MKLDKIHWMSSDTHRYLENEEIETISSTTIDFYFSIKNKEVLKKIKQIVAGDQIVSFEDNLFCMYYHRPDGKLIDPVILLNKNGQEFFQFSFPHPTNTNFDLRVEWKDGQVDVYPIREEKKQKPECFFNSKIYFDGGLFLKYSSQKPIRVIVQSSRFLDYKEEEVVLDNELCGIISLDKYLLGRDYVGLIVFSDDDEWDFEQKHVIIGSVGYPSGRFLWKKGKIYAPIKGFNYHFKSLLVYIENQQDYDVFRSFFMKSNNSFSLYDFFCFDRRLQNVILKDFKNSVVTMAFINKQDQIVFDEKKSSSIFKENFQFPLGSFDKSFMEASFNVYQNSLISYFPKYSFYGSSFTTGSLSASNYDILKRENGFCHDCLFFKKCQSVIPSKYNTNFIPKNENNECLIKKEFMTYE